MHSERMWDLLVPAAAVIATLMVAEGIARAREPGQAEASAARLAPKEAGVRRVVFYGESTVHGTPVPTLGFVAQLRFYLSERYPQERFELVNLAEPGMSSGRVLERVRESLRSDVDLAFVAMGHTEFLNLEPERTSATLGKFSALDRYVRTVKSRAAARAAVQSKVDPPYLTPVIRGSKMYRDKKDAMENNVQAIVREMRNARVPVVIGVLGSNIRDWAPVNRRLPPGYRGDAMGLYSRGRALFAGGMLRAAHDTLVAAKDADPVPWRALSEFNDAMLRTARKESAFVVRIDSVVTSHAPGGTPGFELFADNVHFTPEGNAIVAKLLLGEIEQRLRLVPAHPADTTCCALESYWRHLGGDSVRRALLTDYLLKNGQYAMKPPFFSYATARMYLVRADSVSPADWRVETNLASVDMLEGKRDVGLERLRTAMDHAERAGKKVDPRNLADAPYLAKALRTVRLDFDSVRVGR